jgi:2,4-dienoyl-CoA reductase-like NADH-dependent reductase (Old Yellow Enzyme family)
MLSYVDTIARGGAGLIILGHGYIRPDGRLTDNETGLDNDEQVSRLALVAQQAQRAGAKIAIQISHGGRQCRPAVIEALPLAPSPVTVKKTGVEPRELQSGEVADLIQEFADSARRARDAGFDAIQVHAAHGYLISQFLSPATNRRNDAWGGSPANRRRFLMEVLEAVRAEVGSDYPLLIKINLDDCVPDGIPLEEAIDAARAAADAGVVGIEVSGGMVDSEQGAARKEIEPGKKEAYFRPLARAAKEAIDTPVILVGGLKSIEVISDVLGSGDADLVALGRPLIREPHLPLDWLDGRPRPADCLSCNRCALYKDRALRCESLALEQEQAEEAATEGEGSGDDSETRDELNGGGEGPASAQTELPVI